MTPVKEGRKMLRKWLLLCQKEKIVYDILCESEEK